MMRKTGFGVENLTGDVHARRRACKQSVVNEQLVCHTRGFLSVAECFLVGTADGVLIMNVPGAHGQDGLHSPFSKGNDLSQAEDSSQEVNEREEEGQEGEGHFLVLGGGCLKVNVECEVDSWNKNE